METTKDIVLTDITKLELRGNMNCVFWFRQSLLVQLLAKVVNLSRRSVRRFVW